MFSDISISKDHLSYFFTASTRPLNPHDGQERVALIVSCKLTVAEYSTHYCSLAVVVESPSQYAFGLPFGMIYHARQAVLNDSYSALKEPSKTNQILTEFVGQLGEYNGRVVTTKLHRWADYAKPAKLSEEAEQRIDKLMEDELTDEPLNPAEAIGEAIKEMLGNGVCVDDSPDWHKEPLEGMTEVSKPSDFTGDPADDDPLIPFEVKGAPDNDLSDDDMIPDSGYDGLYA